ncbi:MAG: phytoene desaturase family protein [Myxococcota bacterium]
MLYDVIVVGAGIGGLTAASILSAQGYSILILEKQNLLGGNCNYFEEEGIRFEYAVHQIAGSCKHLIEYLGKYGIELKLIKIDSLIDIYYPDKVFHISGGYDNFLEMLNKFKNDKQNKKFIEFLKNVNTIVEHYEWIQYINKTSAPEFPLKFALRGATSLYKFWESRNMTATGFMQRFFTEIADNEIAYFLSPYIGLPPSRSSATLNICANASYIGYGSFYPQGGSRALTTTFYNAIKKVGVDIRLDCEVIQVKKSDDKFIVLTGDEQIFMSRAIILNAPVKNFFEKIYAGEEAGTYKKKLLNLKISLAPIRIFCIYEGDVSALNKFGYESFIYDTRSIEDYFSGVEDGRFYGFSLLFPFKIDTTNHNENKYPVVITTLSKYMDCLEFENKKDDILGQIFDILDKYTNNLSKKLKIVSILTPDRLRNRTNVDRGAMYGWECSPAQTFFNRLGHRTDIAGIFLTGHWTRPANGISSVMRSGINCAKYVKKYIKKS